jgi:hypothetical protein
MSQVASRFVGVGIDQYDNAALTPLSYAFNEVEELAKRLEPLFVGNPLRDATRLQVDNELTAVAASKCRTLVLLWAGHGKAKGTLLWLSTKDGQILANEVISRCVDSGASQLLLMIDACHAGIGLDDAAKIVEALIEEFPDRGERVWFGIVVSCRAEEKARDGAFGESLQRLLSEGPRSADMQLRWSRYNQLITGDDLASALEEEWKRGSEQRVKYHGEGRRVRVLPNPLWEPDAPEEVVEHLLLAARGDIDAERSWFTGRVDEVNEVAAWVSDKTPGVRVVTGSAGTGKSAIVGRVVSLSDPSERSRLRSASDDAGAWGEAVPGERSVHAHVQVRGMKVDQVAEQLDGQLVRSVVVDGQQVAPKLLRSEFGRRNAAELVGALQRAYQQGGEPPVIVVDGLDEARGEVSAIVDDLLIRAAAFAVIIVATRAIDEPKSVLDELAPVALLELDAPAQRESQRNAMYDYVRLRLSGVDAKMDPALVAEELIRIKRPYADRESFLLVRIAVDQLLDAPIDTSMPDWRQHVSGSIGAALERDIARVTPPDGLSDEVDAPQLARTMLAALTWSYGAGFPEDEWLVVAAALTDTALNASQASWLLRQLGRYVIQGGESGVAVYRVAHQTLIDYLRPRRAEWEPPDPAGIPIWSALAARYEQLLRDGHRAREYQYLFRTAGNYAGHAGDDGVSKLIDLAQLDPELEIEVEIAKNIIELIKSPPYMEQFPGMRS